MATRGLVALALVSGCGSDSDEPAGPAGAGNAGRSASSGGDAGSAGRGQGATSGAESGRGASGGSEGGGAGVADSGNSGEPGAAGDQGGSSASGGEGGSAEAGAAGAAPDPVELPPLVSGTRLRAKVYVGDDGSRHAIGLYDTELELDCEFANLGADGYRCVPLPAVPYTDIFADDRCMIAAIGYEPGCGAQRYEVRAIVEDECDGMPRRDVRLIGDASPSAFRDNAGTCEPHTVDSSTVEWHAVSPADAADFVEATLSRVSLGAGLRALVVTAADGARVARSFWYADTPCEAREITGAGVRCTPAAVALPTTYFADELCTDTVGYWLGVPACGDVPQLAYATSVQKGACSTRVTELVSVTPFVARSAWGKSGDMCVTRTVFPADFRRYVIGDAVDASALPELVVERPGTERLRSNVYRTEGGSSVGLGTGIYDTELEVECTPYTFEDGVVRCAPVSRALGSYYSDANCSVPIVPADDCLERPYYGDIVADGSCASNAVMRGVYVPGAAYSGPVHQWVEDEERTCEELLEPSESFVALEPVDPSDLATLTVEIE
ncbi:MAG TPA: hypothetical protein VGK73_28205 [Polyangiaceae bacterium]